SRECNLLKINGLFQYIHRKCISGIDYSPFANLRREDLHPATGRRIVGPMSPVRGRGAGSNPPNRFYRRSVVPDPEAADPEEPLPRTQFLKDVGRTIIARNDSPDIGFDTSVNP